MSGSAKSIAAIIAAPFKKYWQVLVGHGIWSLASWLYDDPLYIYVIATMGPIDGGVVMTAGSLVICLATLVYYRNKQVGWLGYDVVIEGLTDRAHHWGERVANWKKRETIFASIVAWILFIPADFFIIILKAMKIRKIGDIVAFFALSIFEDPFIATAYLRHGRTDGIKAKDLAVFFASVLVSNGYWILRTVAIIEAAICVWHLWQSFVEMVIHFWNMYGSLIGSFMG